MAIDSDSAQLACCSPPRSLVPSQLTSFYAHFRPSLSFLPLVQHPPPSPLPALPHVRYPFNNPREYRLSRKAIILFAFAVALFVPVTIFIALLTSFVQAKEQAAAAASSSAALSSPSRP
ncbi:hypothetical protein OF83DRAFT_1280199 [Amylostereum chailletii]|nr:hypothetical protein OF83DRAFT_1280199 [Amylostereum chailletii]